MPDELTQLGKFKEAAREAGLDDTDEDGFTAAVRRMATHRPKKDAEPERPE